jgi:cytochrome P450
MLKGAEVERVLELLVLGVAVSPLLRLSASRSFRRKLHAFPGAIAALTGLLALYGIFVVYLALYSPTYLRLMAILALCAVVYERWRARPNYGCSCGLPPGTLTLAPLNPWRDHLFYQKQAARYGPIFKMSHFLQPMICVVGLKPALDLLRRYDDVLSVAPLAFNRFIPGGFLRYMDQANHTVYRTIFRSAFARNVIDDGEPFAVRSIRHELSQMANFCSRTPATGIQPEAPLNKMLFVIFVRLFFDIPPDTEQFARLQVLYRVIDFRNSSHVSSREVIKALDEIRAMIQTQNIRSLQLIEGNENLNGSFLAEIIRVNPEAVHDPTVIGNLIYILQTSWRDVAGLLLWTLKMLSDHPDWVTRLREGLASSEKDQDQGSDCLAVRIVMETLRLEQSEYLMRKVMQEIRFKDFVIPQGWLLRICIRESHRSAEVFEEPDTFNPDRFLAHNYNRSEYSAFGASRISCLGEYLTMMVGRIFVTELARGFRWKVVSDGPREYGGFHWKPSSKFRVHIEKL